MIIINKSANYANCGLGKAPVILDSTRELLSGYSMVPSETMLKFQTFLEDIGGVEGDIWQSIDRLYIPLFAFSEKEAFFDIKSGTTLFPNELITDSNISDYYAKTPNGIKINLENFDPQSSGKFNVIKDNDNILLFALSEPISDGGKNIWDFADTGTNSTGLQLKNSLGVNSINVGLANDTEYDPLFLNTRKDNVAFGYTKSNKETQRESNLDLSEITSVNIKFFTKDDYKTFTWTSGVKMYGFGDGLSKENALILANSIAKFQNYAMPTL